MGEPTKTEQDSPLEFAVAQVVFDEPGPGGHQEVYTRLPLLKPLKASFFVLRKSVRLVHFEDGHSALSEVSLKPAAVPTEVWRILARAASSTVSPPQS
jgi:hypothetical protein